MSKTNQDPSDFDTVVRKSGNSIVITIPHNIAKAHNIEPGTSLNVNIRLMGDKEVNQE